VTVKGSTRLDARSSGALNLAMLGIPGSTASTMSACCAWLRCCALVMVVKEEQEAHRDRERERERERREREMHDTR
jgi:hypothetical protein